MRYWDSPAYRRDLKGIRDPGRLAAIHEAVRMLVDSLDAARQPPGGLGLKILRSPYWEIRSSLHDRILFTWTDDLIIFAAAGRHDDIRRFLKSH